MLLTLDEKDPKRLFEGSALLKRLTTYGLLDDTKQKVRFRYLEPRSAAQGWGAPRGLGVCSATGGWAAGAGRPQDWPELRAGRTAVGRATVEDSCGR